MNNYSFIDATTLPSADIVQAATLVVGALNIGRVKMSPDGKFTIDGIPLAQVSPAWVGQPNTDTKSVNRFNFDGKTWTLQYDGQVAIESDRVGLRYIQHLLQRPHKENHVTNLVTGAYGEPEEIMVAKNLFESGVAVSEDDVDEITGEVNPRVITEEFRDEILPDGNRAFVFRLLEGEYKQLAKLEKMGLPDKVLLQREKIKEIQKYLNDHCYHKKNVCFDTRAEKDRKSVAKAIKQSIHKIAEKHGVLSEHLRKSINTGVYCSYQPDVDVSWQVANMWRPVATQE